MKIAVQLFGHLRTFKRCHVFLKRHLLDLYDTDVFIHTWSRLDNSTQSWYSTDKASKIAGEHSNQQFILDTYKPKALSIGEQGFLHEDAMYGENSRSSLLGIKYMLFSKMAVDKLRIEYEIAKNIKYDFVVVLRPDVLLREDINIEKFKHEFDISNETTIHFPANNSYQIAGRKIVEVRGAQDALYIGRPKVITKVSECFHQFDFFYKTFPQLSFPSGVSYPEISFNEYILRCGIVPRFYNTYYHIARADLRNDLVSAPLGSAEIGNKAQYVLNRLAVLCRRKTGKLFWRV